MNASLAEPSLIIRDSSQIAKGKNSPEFDLLLLCARRHLTDFQAQRAREILDQPLNWNMLLAQAQSHRLSPLLYWQVTRTLRRHFPDALGTQLNDRFRANTARTLLLIQDLVNTVELLSRRGIQTIPFKGPVLAEMLYGDAALRECVDLDILVRARDVQEAIRTLLSAGYEDVSSLKPAQQSAFVATQYEYALRSPAGTLVELQWRTVPRYFSLFLDEEKPWNRIRPIQVCGREMNSLSPEDLLLLLSFHGSKHGWEKLIWLADVGELIASSPQLDWGYVIDTARGAGGLRMLLLGITLANKLLGTVIPNEIERPIARDRTAEHIAESICHRLQTSEIPTYVKSQIYLLRVRERWRDRLRYILRFTSTGTPMEWRIVDLPPSLFVVYSFLRVLRGLAKGFGLAMNSASRLIKRRAVV